MLLNNFGMIIVYGVFIYFMICMRMNCGMMVIVNGIIKVFKYKMNNVLWFWNCSCVKV